MSASSILRCVSIAIFLVLASILPTEELSAEDWRQFRGPNAAGKAASSPPVSWSDSQNLKWVVALPGRGVSSPIVVGHRVFLTAYTGFAQSADKAGDIKNLRRHLLCFDRKSGTILWDRSPPTRFPEDKFEGFITDHGYASSTPVSDGERVFAFFGKSGVYAFDLEGNLLWQATVGKESGPTLWGSAASPIVYRDLLIVNACDETQALIAFDKSSGKEIWRAEARLMEGSYSTPVIGRNEHGNDEIVVALADEIWGIDPAGGTLNWWVKFSLGKYICTTPVIADGVAYVAASSKVAAIKLGGNGDVTESHVVWSRNAGPGVPSPIHDDGKLYWVATNSILTCADAASGKTLWRERISTGGRNITYASLFKAGDVWLATTQTNGTISFRLNPTFSRVDANQFASDSTAFKSSAAISDGELFLRSDRFLYCIAKGGKADLKALAEKTKQPKSIDAFAGIISGSEKTFSGFRSRNSVGPAQLLMTFDVNDDDIISKEELAESPMPRFVQTMMMLRGDKNGDGLLDTTERETMQKEMNFNNDEVVGRKDAAKRPLRPRLSGE